MLGSVGEAVDELSCAAVESNQSNSTDSSNDNAGDTAEAVNGVTAPEEDGVFGNSTDSTASVSAWQMGLGESGEGERAQPSSPTEITDHVR